jgi:hypothetical protein
MLKAATHRIQRPPWRRSVALCLHLRILASVEEAGQGRGDWAGQKYAEDCATPRSMRRSVAICLHLRILAVQIVCDRQNIPRNAGRAPQPTFSPIPRAIRKMGSKGLGQCFAPPHTGTGEY